MWFSELWWLSLSAQGNVPSHWGTTERETEPNETTRPSQVSYTHTHSMHVIHLIWQLIVFLSSLQYLSREMNKHLKDERDLHCAVVSSRIVMFWLLPLRWYWMIRHIQAKGTFISTLYGHWQQFFFLLLYSILFSLLYRTPGTPSNRSREQDWSICLRTPASSRLKGEVISFRSALNIINQSCRVWKETDFMSVSNVIEINIGLKRRNRMCNQKMCFWGQGTQLVNLM